MWEKQTDGWFTPAARRELARDEAVAASGFDLAAQLIGLIATTSTNPNPVERTTSFDLRFANGKSAIAN